MSRHCILIYEQKESSGEAQLFTGCGGNTMTKDEEEAEVLNALS